MVETMAAVQRTDNERDDIPKAGKVNEVCKQWLVHEDGVIAHKMQEEEFDFKYGLNRYNRRTVRSDIPVAKVVHSEEEERQQRERMQQLEEQRRIEQKDAEIAKQVMKDMLINAQQERYTAEIKDQELAIKLQEKEKERYERKQRERELARERKRLERDLQHQADREFSGYKRESTGRDNDLNAAMENMRLENDEPEKLLRADGRVEDLGDFSDFQVPPDMHMDEEQRAALQKLQDEELARLLQDQEHKRGAQINKNKLRAIESQDEELARIMQEQERLKVAKRKSKHAQRQMSQPAIQPLQQQRSPPRRMSEGGPPGEYMNNGVQYANTPQYMNMSGSGAQQPHGTDEHVLNMRRARDSPPPLPPGRPTVELNNANESRYSDQGSLHSHDSREESTYYNRQNQYSPHGGQPQASPPQMNAFASIDPTFNRDRDMMDIPQSNIAQVPPPQVDRTPPAVTSASSGEESYPDMPDDQADDFGVVQAQKRSGKPGPSTKSSGSKKDKKGSCKQQ